MTENPLPRRPDVVDRIGSWIAPIVVLNAPDKPFLKRLLDSGNSIGIRKDWRLKVIKWVEAEDSPIFITIQGRDEQGGLLFGLSVDHKMEFIIGFRVQAQGFMARDVPYETPIHYDTFKQSLIAQQRADRFENLIDLLSIRKAWSMQRVS